MNSIFAQQQALLGEKLLILKRLQNALSWSLHRLPDAIDTQTISDPAMAERLAAIVDRFCKLQDQLAAAMRHAHAMLGEKQRSFHDVITWAINESILPDETTWLELRSLRNRLTHEYDPSSDAMPELVTMIRQGHAELATINDQFNRRCAERQLTAS